MEARHDEKKSRLKVDMMKIETGMTDGIFKPKSSNLWEKSNFDFIESVK